MKVKTFYPSIVTPDLPGVLASMEGFGFSVAHKKLDVSETHNTNLILKDENGNRVDIVSTKALPRSVVTIRVNVDNFDEAVAELTAKGYQNRRPDGVETASSRSTMMLSPEGIMFLICEHIKD